MQPDKCHFFITKYFMQKIARQTGAGQINYPSWYINRGTFVWYAIFLVKLR